MFRFLWAFLPVAVFFNVSNSNAQEKRPSDGAVTGQSRFNSRYSVLLGGPVARANSPAKETKNANGNILEWNNGMDTVAVQYGKSESDGIWRLTELDSDLVEIEVARSTNSEEAILKKVPSFRAITTSFSADGVRSKTLCDGNSVDTVQCVTATRKFCHRFREESKTFGKKLGVGKMDGEAARKLTDLGRQCSEYANFLDNTLDPNLTINGRERANRDEAMIEGDLNAIRAMKSALTRKDLNSVKMKGLNDRFGSDESVGATTTGMKNRFERLREVRGDFRALSELAVMCTDVEFSKSAESWDDQSEKERSKVKKTVR